MQGLKLANGSSTCENTAGCVFLLFHIMISHPAPTLCHAFTQHRDKWQGDIIMWHFARWDVSGGIFNIQALETIESAQLYKLGPWELPESWINGSPTQTFNATTSPRWYCRIIVLHCITVYRCHFKGIVRQAFFSLRVRRLIPLISVRSICSWSQQHKDWR